MKYQAFNQDCLTLMPTLRAESIDIICIDPPYKYLKNQKLETDFNELEFLTQAKRILTKDGFIIMFGRGVSFYRMNFILADLGFTFKEEIVWDKRYTSSPLNAIMRTHEMVSIFSKGKARINKVKVEVTEAYKYDPAKIIEVIKRIQSTFGNRKTFDLVNNYFKNGVAELTESNKRGFNTSVSSDFKKRNRTLQFAVSLEEGVTEKSIFSEVGPKFTSIHPTQKPVRLLERLLKLCLPKKDKIVIADFFGGSFSCMESVINLQRENTETEFEGIVCELDKEYFDLGKNRIDNIIL